MVAPLFEAVADAENVVPAFVADSLLENNGETDVASDAPDLHLCFYYVFVLSGILQTIYNMKN